MRVALGASPLQPGDRLISFAQPCVNQGEVERLDLSFPGRSCELSEDIAGQIQLAYAAQRISKRREISPASTGERNGFLQRGDRLGVSALSQQNPAPVVVGNWQVRCHFDDLPI